MCKKPASMDRVIHYIHCVWIKTKTETKRRENNKRYNNNERTERKIWSHWIKIEQRNVCASRAYKARITRNGFTFLSHRIFHRFALHCIAFQCDIFEARKRARKEWTKSRKSVHSRKKQEITKRNVKINERHRPKHTLNIDTLKTNSRKRQCAEKLNGVYIYSHIWEVITGLNKDYQCICTGTVMQ